MTETKTTQQLADQWQDAAERAKEQAKRVQELAAENLDAAAGLQVKSGVKAGLWGDSKYCEH